MTPGMMSAMMSRTTMRAALLLVAAVAVSAASPAERSRLVLDPSGPPGNLLISAQGSAVSINSNLTIEHLAERKWAPVPTRFDAVSRCFPLPPPCLTIEPGQPLRVIRWSGLPCGGQCDGSCINSWRDPGQYRFTATSCDGKVTYHSHPIVLHGNVVLGSSANSAPLRQHLSGA